MVGREGRPGARTRLGLLGPAFVAAVAYVDPGNVAANLTAGAEHGYLLVWVLVLANLAAVVVQYCSARLGLVTRRSLPALLGERITSRSARLAYWAQAELVVAATDVAEVVGGAVALSLLLGWNLLAGGVVVGAVSMALLAVQSRRGQRAFEGVVMTLLAVVCVGFLSGLVVAPVSWTGVAAGLVPRFDGPDTVLLAAGMLGATVMPHAVYAHSALAVDRHAAGDDRRLRLLLEATRWDVGLSLLVAGSVNVGMVVLAAAGLQGVSGTDTIAGAHAAVVQALGPAVGAAFAVGLLASGLASTSVGCYAGSAVMDGLLRRRIPLAVRRAITLVPALLLLAGGGDPTRLLVLSQVFLSLGLPFALVPLALFTSDRDVMGDVVNPRALTVACWVVVVLVVALNLALVALTLLPR